MAHDDRIGIGQQVPPVAEGIRPPHGGGAQRDQQDVWRPPLDGLLDLGRTNRAHVDRAPFIQAVEADADARVHITDQKQSQRCVNAHVVLSDKLARVPCLTT